MEVWESYLIRSSEERFYWLNFEFSSTRTVSFYCRDSIMDFSLLYSISLLSLERDNSVYLLLYMVI